MEDSSRTKTVSNAWLVLVAMGLVAGICLVLSFAISKPNQRKYPERIQVRFWHMWQAEWKDVVNDIADSFNASQDTYEVVALSVPGQAANSKFLLAVAGGDPPDCMAQWSPVIPKWSESKLLTPLNELMTPAEWEDFQKTVYPIARKIGIYKGNLYGVTVGLNVWACYYRIDHLEQANLDPDKFPKTLEELVDWGRKLNRFDSRGGLTRLGFLPQGWGMYVPGFGGGFCDWTGDPSKLTIDRPENLRALEYLVERRKELGFDNVQRFQAGLRQGFATEWPFISGQFSIAVDGQWQVIQMAKYAPEVKYGTAPIPPPAGGRTLFGVSNGNFMIIPRGAKSPKGAWEFIKFWSGLDNPERAAKFYVKGGWLPLSPAIAETPIYREYVRKHPQLKTFLDQMSSENLHSTPPVPFQDYLADRIFAADDTAMRGSLTPRETVDRLMREISVERTRRRELGHDD